ncbi:MAG TPA: DUF2332 domain-containing protein, partial [Chloroflexia bacterium]|nr:DUF2332 domain-containing protein [Chloroflexia bacterium]
PNDPLASYYPSITERPQPPAEAYPAFRAFCLKHLGEIKGMLRDRRVQTNEVQRCACLLPCFGLVSSRSSGKPLAMPLAMVEIGTSAGLHLLWDRYRYDYGEGHICGSPASSVLIKCELRGEERVPLPDLLPYVSMRTGIDLNPLDVRDPDDALWLRALIWAENLDRPELLRSAIEVARQDPPTLVQGDVLDVLPGVLASVPKEAALCIFHSFTMIQLPEQAVADLEAMLRVQSHKRPIYRVSIEGLSGEPPKVELSTYEAGSVLVEHLADCHPHGRWLEWKSGC